MTSSMFDVAVVGAGPAGASSAALLARLGCRVALIDRAHFPRPKACAEYMSPGVVAAARGLGLEPALVGARRVRGMEIMSPEGTVLRLEYDLRGRPVDAFTLTRQRFDAALVSLAADAGAQVMEGVVIREPDLADGNVVGIRGTERGRSMYVSSRLTIIAEGARSVLARSLALACRPRWPMRLGLVAHYEGVRGLSEEFGRMHVHSGGYCGVAPLPDGVTNVGLVVEMDAIARSGRSASRFLEDWIRSHPALRETMAGGKLIDRVRGVAPIGARARKSWFPGALLVGDAAGFFDPFTGEGIYRAIRGAELATRVAMNALEPGGSVGRLHGYDTLRAEAFRWKQGVTSLVQLFVQFPALMEYALPRLSTREEPMSALSGALGDVADAREFLRPRMLWSALRP
jgi:menaquinone-9 beta-reductase